MNFLDWLLARQETKLTKLERQRSCRTCEVLTRELEHARAEKNRLLNELLDKPKAPMIPDIPAIKPIGTGMMEVPQFKSWEAKRRALEAEDLRKAQVIEEQKKLDQINKLEKEVGLDGQWT